MAALRTAPRTSWTTATWVVPALPTVALWTSPAGPVVAVAAALAAGAVLVAVVSLVPVGARPGSWEPRLHGPTTLVSAVLGCAVVLVPLLGAGPTRGWWLVVGPPVLGLLLTTLGAATGRPVVGRLGIGLLASGLLYPLGWASVLVPALLLG